LPRVLVASGPVLTDGYGEAPEETDSARQ